MRTTKAIATLFTGAAVLFAALPSAFSQEIDEDELEFRFWRNIKEGNAISAALLLVNDDATKMQLYKKGGQKVVVNVADFHAEDQAYVKEWQAWKIEDDKRSAKNGGTSESVQDASAAIKQAVMLRVDSRENKGDVTRLGSSKEIPTEHEFKVTVMVRKGAPKLPPGELHVVAYIGEELKDARLRGGKTEGAWEQDSKALTEKKLKVEKIEEFPAAGGYKDFKYNLVTTQIRGEGSRKVGKKTRSFDFRHDQNLLGIRARVLVGGKLAAEFETRDLERTIARYKD